MVILSHFSDRKDELEGEVFEILLTFSDFMSFKEMFLDYRAVSILDSTGNYLPFDNNIN